MSAAPTAAVRSPFDVTLAAHLLSGWVHHCRRFWCALGRLETRVFQHELERITVERPLFVCGLARSGSSLLHEILAAYPGVATQRVKDYPCVFTPLWWRQATRQPRDTVPQERAHGDRIFITANSPEALEEMIWSAFFPHAHDPNVSNLLLAEAVQPEFERFYRAHLRKLLLAERATRYVAKANYHIARLPYLLRLFPDTRFFLPVRAPVTHIASLMRQQERFSAAGRQFPRSLAQLQRAGHFEFGLDRRPINLGDSARVQTIQQLWNSGEEVRGWACYWALVYDYLADLLAANAALRRSTLIVRFEDLCDRPSEILESIRDHAALPYQAALVQEFVQRISPPDYYADTLSSADRTVIAQETATVAQRWGY